jgi:hypothetical protein
MSKIYFFQVSLKENIPIIKKNYLNLKKFYKKFSIVIICPDKEIQTFKEALNFSEITFIKESFFIKLTDFKNIFNSYCKNKRFLKKNNLRISWYYQQVLKICFIFYFFENKRSGVESKYKKLVLWDADSIILDKIEFFIKNRSQIFCCLFQIHRNYFKTLFYIFKKLPNFYYSGICQFNSISRKDFIILNSVLNSFLLKKFSTPIWITKIMASSVFSTHKTYSTSLFSEYELLTISKLLYEFKKQIPVLYFRSYLGGALNSMQIGILKILGFKHLTYDFYNKIHDKRVNVIRFLIKVFKFKLYYFFKYYWHTFCYYYIIFRKKKYPSEKFFI